MFQKTSQLSEANPPSIFYNIHTCEPNWTFTAIKFHPHEDLIIITGVNWPWRQEGWVKMLPMYVNRPWGYVLWQGLYTLEKRTIITGVNQP